MLNIRRNTFETNSSSTHSITICTLDEFREFENGKVYWVENSWCLDFGDKKFVTLAEIEEAIKKQSEERNNPGIYDQYKAIESGEDEYYDSIDDYLREEYCIKTYDNYSDDYESYIEEYTTLKGENIVAFGYYGNNY